MTTARLHETELKHLFVVFDAERSGTVNVAELTNALRALGWLDVGVDQAGELVQDHFGADCDRVNFEQFKALVAAVTLPSDSPVECYQAFKLFDMSRIGKISVSDLKCAGEIATGRAVPNELVRELMAIADRDGDGYISLPEFRKAVAKGGKGTEDGFLDLGAEGSLDRTGNGAGISAPQAAQGSAAIMLRNFGGVNIEVDRVSGTVSREAVREALAGHGYGPESFSDADFGMVFDECDEDGDSRLTIDEYQRLLEGLGENANERPVIA